MSAFSIGFKLITSRSTTSRLYSTGRDVIAATELFSSWAVAGKDEKMASGHLSSVLEMLEEAKLFYPSDFKGPFRFLDIGCGNGWVTRMVGAFPGCTKAIGVDGATEMVSKAKRLLGELPADAQAILKCDFVESDLSSFEPTSPVDIALSMVSV
jgi:SAM-dependent methyltransferase